MIARCSPPPFPVPFLLYHVQQCAMSTNEISVGEDDDDEENDDHICY